jgi:hypothetical protein
MTRQFNIHPSEHRRGAPHSVPWDLVAPHEAQALINHGQTLERLHARGGLDCVELYCVMHGLRWPHGDEWKNLLEPALEFVKGLVA